jgi:hypothetical protein
LGSESRHLWVVGSETGHALKLCLYSPEVQPGPLCNGALADLIPVELDRVVHVAGEVSDDQVEIGDAGGMTLCRLGECLIKNGLSREQFVHSSAAIPSLNLAGTFPLEAATDIR